MTPLQLDKYDFAMSVHRYSAMHPELNFVELGKYFKVSPKVLRNTKDKMKHHLETGEPYFKKNKRKGVRTGMQYKKPYEPPVNRVTVKDPEAYWAECGVRFS